MFTDEAFTVFLERPKDCADIQTDGHRYSGVFTVYPEGVTDPEGVEVFCDLHTNDGGWLVGFH